MNRRRVLANLGWFMTVSGVASWVALFYLMGRRIATVTLALLGSGGMFGFFLGIELVAIAREEHEFRLGWLLTLGFFNLGFFVVLASSSIPGLLLGFAIIGVSAAIWPRFGQK